MILSRRRHLSLVLVAGCAATPPPEPAGPTPPPIASAATPPAPPAPEAPASPVPPPRPASPFHLIASLAGESRVHLVGDGAYVSAPPQEESKGDTPADWFTAQITPTGLSPVGPAAKGTLWYGFVNKIAGAPGGDAFMAWSTDNGRLARTEIYRKNGGSWVDQRQHEGMLLGGISRWKDGSTLALFYAAMRFSGWNAPVLEVLGKKGAAVPRMTRGEGKCGTLSFPVALAALPSGEVFTLGWKCKSGPDGTEVTDEPVFEAWAAGETKGRIVALPPVKGAHSDADPTLLARAPNDVYALIAGESDSLLHFDGATWATVPLPGGKVLGERELGNDGSLWLVVDGKLFSRPAGATAWANVPLPDDAWQVGSLAVRSASEVYVTTSTGELLATSIPAPATPPPRPTVAAKPAHRVLMPATKSCTSIFAMLFGFTKVTPPDYDFPLTRKALKGKTQLKGVRFVVTENGGRKFFGAIAPDLATGNALIDAVKKGVQGSAPALVCLDPKVVSELKLDLATGEVKK